MKVLISGEGLSTSDPESVAGAIVIGAEPIDFAIDFGPMMDRWGGGVAIADITPTDEERDLYRVTDFEDLPMSLRQSGDNAVVLDSQDGTWFLSLDGSDEGIAVEHSGRIPSATEPGCSALARFMLQFGVAMPVQEIVGPS